MVNSTPGIFTACLSIKRIGAGRLISSIMRIDNNSEYDVQFTLQAFSIMWLNLLQMRFCRFTIALYRVISCCWLLCCLDCSFLNTSTYTAIIRATNSADQVLSTRPAMLGDRKEISMNREHQVKKRLRPKYEITNMTCNVFSPKVNAVLIPGISVQSEKSRDVINKSSSMYCLSFNFCKTAISNKK